MDSHDFKFISLKVISEICLFFLLYFFNFVADKINSLVIAMYENDRKIFINVCFT